MGAHDLSYVSERVGEEATEVGCCGDGGTDREGLLAVWDAADDSTSFQVLWTHFFVLLKRLSRGGAEYTAGAGKVGTNGEDFGEGVDNRTAVRFCMEVVQALILFGSET